MASKHPRAAQAALIAVFGALSLLLLGLIVYRWARDDSLARLVELSGTAERDSAASAGSWLPARVGDRFQNGDGARTPAQAVAHFRLINGALLRLEPASLVRFQTSGEQGKVGLHVEMGELDVQSAAEAVHVESEFGELHIDANSSIRMRRTADRLVVDVELGRLELGAERQALGSGQSVQLELGGVQLDAPAEAPSPPPVPPAPDAGAREPEPEPEPAPQPELAAPAADLVVHPGDSVTVHDATPPTAVGFALSHVCEGPALVRSGKQKIEAAGRATLPLGPGRHRYEVRCLDRPKAVAARGLVSVLADAGTRQLPSFAPKASVLADGRRYTVMYQYRLPEVTFSWAAAPAAESYTLEIDGRSLATTSATHELSGLSSGTHRLTYSAASTPARRSRTTTIEVVKDLQAPAARVSAPAPGFERQSSVNVAGQALPGWSVAIDGQAIDLDPARNFSLEHAGNDVIAIAFTHPSHGTHYYLRRPRAAQPFISQPFISQP